MLSSMCETEGRTLVTLHLPFDEIDTTNKLVSKYYA